MPSTSVPRALQAARNCANRRGAIASRSGSAPRLFATCSRERGFVPWAWILDEERTLSRWAFAASVAEYLVAELRFARIDCWGGEAPPLVLCESRATAAVLQEALAGEYLTPIAGTKGQARGFLHVEVAPLLAERMRPVLWVGDRDRSGEDIEQNCRRVLEREAGGELEWTRLAMTAEQTEGIEPIWKVDGRDGEGRWAWEVESIGQTGLVDLVRAALDALLPEPLHDVHERERLERAEAARRLATWNGRS